MSNKVKYSFDCDSGPMGLVPTFEQKCALTANSCDKTVSTLLSNEGSGVMNISITDNRPQLPCTSTNNESADRSPVVGIVNNTITEATAATVTHTTPYKLPVLSQPQNQLATSATTVNKRSRSLYADCFHTNTHDTQKEKQEWTLVSKRKQKYRYIGNRGRAVTDINCKFKAADIIIPMYIYNVSKETSASDIVTYIEKVANYTARLEKIDMYADKGYDAYKQRHVKISAALNSVSYKEAFELRSSRVSKTICSGAATILPVLKVLNLTLIPTNVIAKV
ncbi:hypothetical protein ACJJTC_017879 [Scirpophaga incertulas]